MHNRAPCEHNNERNAWAVNNLAPLYMPFLSIIAYYNKPNKSQNQTNTLFITCLCKNGICFYLEKKLVRPKPEQPHLVNTSLFAIFTNQHLHILDSSQNQMAIGVTPDPFFRHHKEKRKKVVWPCETRIRRTEVPLNFFFLL